MASMDRLVDLYRRAESLAVPFTLDPEAPEGTRIVEDLRIKDIVAEMGLQQSQQTPLTDGLKQLGCIVVDRRGVAGRGSTWLLLMDPETARFADINDPRRVYARERNETRRLDLAVQRPTNPHVRKLNYENEVLVERQTLITKDIADLKNKLGDLPEFMRQITTSVADLTRRVEALEATQNGHKNIPSGNAGQGPGDVL